MKSIHHCYQLIGLAFVALLLGSLHSPAIDIRVHADTNHQARFDSSERRALDLIAAVCEALSVSVVFNPPVIATVAPTVSDIERNGNVVGERILYRFKDQEVLRMDVMGGAGQPSRLVAETRKRNSPQFFVATDTQCMIREIRRLVYIGASKPDRIREVQRLDAKGFVVNVEPVNPPLPTFATREESAEVVRVAMVDSGVNYLLSALQQGLSRDEQGGLLGYDFWDMDELPFDAQIA